MEGAYADLGKFNFGTATGDGDFHPRAASLSAVGVLPLQEHWSLYGKAGVARTETKALDTSDSENGLLAGAGIAYDFNRNVYAWVIVSD